MREGSSLTRGTLFFLVLTLAGLPVPARSAEAIKSSDLNPRRLVEEALAYFEAEEDPASFVALGRQVIRSGLRDRVILERIASYYLKNRDRPALNSFFEEVSKHHGCRLRTRDAAVCADMKALWVGNLDSVYFYEDSASKAERLRRLLLGKDCSGAQAVLRELETREGPLMPLLEAELRVAECLADIATQDRLRVRLEELRLFPSDV